MYPLGVLKWFETVPVSSKYDRLRTWYLARLRKSAIDAQQQVDWTPSALIAADRETLEKLVAEKEAITLQRGIRRQKSDPIWIFLLASWLVILTAIFFGHYLSAFGDLDMACRHMIQSASGARIFVSGGQSTGREFFFLEFILIWCSPWAFWAAAWVGERLPGRAGDESS